MFNSCTSLQSINVSKENNYYSSSEGRLFDKDETVIIKFPEGKDEKKYIIPGSVTEIGEFAFSGCTSLQSVGIPNSVTKIGEFAFSGCNSLQSIDIPKSVTKIQWKAFQVCTSLQSIHCQIKSPNTVNIDKEAFAPSHYDTCTLFIPPGTRWEYRHHPVFGKFKYIEIDLSLSE